MIVVTAVQGTWAWASPWWKDGSPFWAYMAGHGIAPARINGLPFRWSTDLADSWKFWAKRRSDWEAGGDALAYYLDALPERERVVLAHSHGGQCALMCAALGVKIDRLVTLATPARKDMADTVAQARPNIREWWHVCDADTDNTAWWGAFGDGHVGNTRTFPAANQNVLIPNIGHSKLLNDERLFWWWSQSGVIPMLKGAS